MEDIVESIYKIYKEKPETDLDYCDDGFDEFYDNFTDNQKKRIKILMNTIIKNDIFNDEKYHDFWMFCLKYFYSDEKIFEHLLSSKLRMEKTHFHTHMEMVPDECLRTFFSREDIDIIQIPSWEVTKKKKSFVCNRFFNHVIDRCWESGKHFVSPNLVLEDDPDECWERGRFPMLCKLTKLTSEDVIKICGEIGCIEWIDLIKNEKIVEVDLNDAVNIINKILSSVQHFDQHDSRRREDYAVYNFIFSQNVKMIEHLIASGIDPQFHLAVDGITPFETIFKQYDSHGYSHTLMEIKKLILDYDDNPQEAVFNARKKTLVGIKNETLVYLQSVMVSDGFFTTTNSFFKIASSLPLELQMVLANRAFGKNANFISGDIDLHLAILTKN